MALPEPELGMVIGFAYLWHHQFLGGANEGRKDRPTVIVSAIKRNETGHLTVTVLPITHAAPPKGRVAVELPDAVKRHIGLDAQRSWVIVDEGNKFEWPGFDLRPRPSTGRTDYGFLPPRLFANIRAAFAAVHSSRRSKIVQRD